MKKILYLITSSGWGGAERYVVKLAEAASEKFKVEVMAGASEGLELFKALPSTVKKIVLTNLKRNISPASDLRSIIKLRKYIDENSIDLLHCNSSKAGLLGALAARASSKKPKVVYTAHGWGFSEQRSSFFKNTVLMSELIASRYRSATIVLSDREVATTKLHHLAETDKLRKIPHGISASEINFMSPSEARSRLESLCCSKLTPFVIGTIANAYPPKALDVLMEAFTETAAQSKECSLVIIGNGPEMEKIVKVRARSPVAERIFLLGAVPEAARLLRGFDLFALSSVKEGMPWVLLEASLAGVPILATRVGAIPEMIEHLRSGYLVEPGDKIQLQAGMSKMIEDKELYSKLKSEVSSIANTFVASKMISQTLDLYSELLRAETYANA